MSYKVTIPMSIALDQEIKNALPVLFAIVGRVDDKKETMVSNTDLAIELGITAPTVSVHIRQLRKAEYIKTLLLQSPRGNGSLRIITLLSDIGIKRECTARYCANCGQVIPQHLSNPTLCGNCFFDLQDKRNNQGAIDLGTHGVKL